MSVSIPASHTNEKAVTPEVGSDPQLVDLLIRSYDQLLASSPFDRNKPEKLHRRFVRSLKTDLRGTVKRYNTLAHSIIATCYDAQESTVTGEFLAEMKDTPIFREYLLFYKTGDVSVLKFIMTFLVFAKKAPIEFDDLQETAFRSWLQVEEDLASLTFESRDLAVVKTVISQLLDVSTFDDTLLLPKHGSGQVAEKVGSIHDKFDHLAWNRKLEYTFRDTRFARYLKNVLPDMKKSGGVDESRTIYVPKDVRSFRSVGMEPTKHMYFQQEVMRWLVSCMEHSPLRRIVDLRDQSLNQQYAYWGSAHKYLDTIDLSSASDRVHIDLVRGTFPEKILYYLLGTRTSSTLLPTGKSVELNKFAPMGSALCFPVQCVLFSAISMCAYIMADRSWTWEHLSSLSQEDLVTAFNVTFRNLNRDYRNPDDRLIMPRVYGDDIICDTRVTDHVTDLLEHFGLVVNKEKSFTAGQSVRESCGVYAFNGEDFTPLYFRVGEHKGKLNVTLYASLVAAVNRAGDFGYRRLQSFLLRELKELVHSFNPSCSVPFTDDRNIFGVWTKNMIRPSTLRENADWQISEVRTVRIVPRGQSPIKDDVYLYNQWIRSKIRDGSEDLFTGSSPRILPRYMRLSPGWTPVRM